MAFSFQMQARSSTDGLLYTWITATPDFEAASFPGPGVAQDVAVATRINDNSAGTENATKINDQRVPWKATARFAITSNIASLSAFTVTQIEGTAVESDRVLLAGQSTASQNGLYDVGVVGGGTAPLTRASDMAASADCIPGSRVHVSEGTRYQNSDWYLATTGSITLDSTGLDFRKAEAVVNLDRFLPLTSNVAEALNLAIAALPSEGGTIDARCLSGSYLATQTVTIDRPVEIIPGKAATVTWTVTPGIDIQNNFKMVGNDRAVTWRAKSDGVLFTITGGSFPGPSGGNFSKEAHIEIRGMSLRGQGTTSSVFDTSATTGFNEGKLILKDNLISDCRDGVYIGVSVYYSFVQHNTFVNCSRYPLYIGNSSNTEWSENVFRYNTGTVTIEGFGSVANGCQWLNLFGNDNPDVRFYVTADGSEGGFAKLTNCNFFGDNEGLSPVRCRIEIVGTSPGFTAPPSLLTGNTFQSVRQFTVSSASVSGDTVTVTLSSPHGIPGGASVWLSLFDMSNATFNGVFLCARTGATTFTYTSTRATGAACVSGTVVPGWVPASVDADEDHFVKAIRIANPIAHWLFDDNEFSGYPIMVADVQRTAPPRTTSGVGLSVWGARNRTTSPFFGAHATFLNGGVHFTIVEPQANVADTRVTDVPTHRENVETRNLLDNTESFTIGGSAGEWVKAAALTLTTGQTDPSGLGTTRAVKIVNDGTAGSAALLQGFTASGPTVYFEFWAKAGSLTDGKRSQDLLVGIYNNDQAGFDVGEYVALTEEWQLFRFTAANLDVGEDRQIIFYPQGGHACEGEMYLAFPHVSEFPSDYRPTVGVDATIGARFDKYVQVAGLRSATRGSVGHASVTGTTGLGTGPTIASETANNDMAGIVTFTTAGDIGGSTKGTIEVTFALPYPGGVTPVIVASLLDSNNAWADGATCRVKSVANDKFNVAVDNNGNVLGAGNSYAFQYTVMGR